jgi:hypothetical protein
MTDTEISRALALAIGWSNVTSGYSGVYVHERRPVIMCRRFDYRDWAVAGPIAERYDCFPQSTGATEWYSYVPGKGRALADTPQKAIALAVINAKGKK